MPLPSRQDELYRRICKDIREKYLPGMVLPTEPAYACLLGCGRTTLRKVLARLQEENRICRTHKGTFVLDDAKCTFPLKKTMGKNWEERPLFLLIPCVGYMEKVDDFSLRIHHQVMAGAMREAIERGSHLVTLPVSETNKSNGIECIDFALSQLKSLREGDKVLFFGRWFRQLLPALAAKKCHTAYISQMPYPFEVKKLNTVTAFTGYSTSAFIFAGLEALKKHGKKSVGCIYFSLDAEEKMGVEKEFFSFLAQNKMQGIFQALPFHISPEEKNSSLEKFVIEHGAEMDSFLYCPHLRMPSPLEKFPVLPEHILLVCEETFSLKLHKHKSILTIRDELENSARDLARTLLLEESSSVKLYPYQTESVMK